MPFLSTSFSTLDTVGALRRSTFEREMMYLCNVSYSLAEIVYRSVLRRMGSAVDLADGRSPSLDAGAIVGEEDYVLMCCWNGEKGVKGDCKGKEMDDCDFPRFLACAEAKTAAN